MPTAGRSGAVAPFRPFFLLAALDAIAGGAVWTPPLLGLETGWRFMTAGEWHRDALLFGTVPAMLAGFLLTALPRWTGRPAIPATVTWALVALWLCGRGASVLVSQAAGLAVASLFCLVLTLIVTGTVIAARDRRNVKVAMLLAAYCAGTVLTAASVQVEPALRLVVASVVGLLVTIGGRVVPALTTAFAEHGGDAPAIRRSFTVERVAAVAALCALSAWVAAPQATPTAFACALAAFAQAVRAAQWRGWRVRASPVLALHAGYGWIVAGFALAAIHVVAPAQADRLAAIHVWMIGAMGTMGLAIMASMMRRHSNRAFARSAWATAAFASMTASCLSRLLACAIPGDPALWMTLSGAFWVAAFCLFLIAFGRMR